MIISQVAPGQEEGNAQLLVQNNAGRLGLNPGRHCPGLVEEAFADGARVYRKNGPRTSPGSAALTPRAITRGSSSNKLA